MACWTCSSGVGFFAARASELAAVPPVTKSALIDVGAPLIPEARVLAAAASSANRVRVVPAVLAIRLSAWDEALIEGMFMMVTLMV